MWSSTGRQKDLSDTTALLDGPQVDDADSPKNTAIHMIFQAAAADGGGAAGSAVGGGAALRTFATRCATCLSVLSHSSLISLTFLSLFLSNFKREYDKTSIVPITKAAQIVGKISEFIHMYCHVNGLTSELEKAAAEAFARSRRPR